MKLIVGIFLGLFAVAIAQERTVTQDLLDAQRELSLGHRFFETLLHSSRGSLSNYIHRIEREVVNGFLDNYAIIKNVAIETNQIMDDFESSVCKDRIRTRWDLQVKRYGSKLSQCLVDASMYIRSMTQELNNIHATAHRTGNQVQNQGLSVLTELDIFTGRDSFYDYINRRFRIILATARPYQDRFDALVNDIIEREEDIVYQLSYCFRTLPRAFKNEAAADLERINACYSDS